jgi:vitamin B12 transporter
VKNYFTFASVDALAGSPIIAALTAGVAAAFLIIPFNLLAAERASDSQEPAVMVVSASRTDMELTRVASSVTVIDRELIEQRQSVYIVDMLRDVPGLSVNRSGSAGSLTEVRSRGGDANQLLVLIDGIRANDPAQVDQFQWQYLTSNDVERVEIVRGPQSSIWGSDANTGVVNIITRKGKGGLSGSGFVEGGSYDSLGGGLNIGGKGDIIDWGLNGSYVEQDGFNNARQGDEDDPFKNTTIGGSFGVKPSESSRIALVARYTDADTKTDWQDCVPSPGNDPCAQVTADSEPDSTQSEQLYAGLSGEIGFIDNRWTHQLQLNSTATKTDFIFQYRDFFDPTQILVDSSSSEGSILELRYQTNWDFARGGSAEGADLVTFAIDHQTRGYENSYGVDDDSQQTGFVLEGRTLLVDALTLTASLRYDDNSDYENVTSWRISGGYDFYSTGTRLRAAAGTGQKAPTMTELYGFFPGFQGNPDLDPEKSEGWEVGIDQSFFDETYRIAATYFDERLQDQIVGISLPGFIPSVTNAPGETKRKGVEVGVSGDLTSNLNALLSYTYLDTDAVVLSGPTIVGRAPEIRKPRNTLALNLNYRFLDQRANVNLNASYTDKQLDSIFFSDFSSSRTELDSFTVVDLAGEYKVASTVVVYGRVDNLFDEDYEEVFSYNVMGRAAYVGARVSLSR